MEKKQTLFWLDIYFLSVLALHACFQQLALLEGI